MNPRDEILARLRQAQRDEPLPPPWQSRRDFPDLVARFTQALTAVKGEVHRVDSLAAAYDLTNQLLRQMEAEKVVVNDERPLPNLPRLPHITYHQVGQEDAALRDFCASADAGLTTADAALAETGTLIVTSGPGKSRLVSLLPPVHMALVSTAVLTTDLFTWTAGFNRQLPANLNFISGPSKTADIEQTMAVGVHGPKRFIVILYA
ncbi:MAG TPA: lactate utilization protein [Chloroflexota bacterium]|nr:lactate utilization protein [Chloroflexota bacterium]HUM71253.1 lactate utilization protein [Chloroflexota bacterium]